MTPRKKTYKPDVEFKLIPIKDLVTNPAYQDRNSEDPVNNTVGELNLSQFKEVKVKRRNGIHYVIDGQYTIELVALKSGSHNTPIWCMVYDDIENEKR